MGVVGQGRVGQERLCTQVRRLGRQLNSVVFLCGHIVLVCPPNLSCFPITFVLVVARGGIYIVMEVVNGEVAIVIM